MPDRDEVGEVAAEPSFAVAIETDAAVDAFDTAGCAVELIQGLEQKGLYLREIGATML